MSDWLSDWLGDGALAGASEAIGNGLAQLGPIDGIAAAILVVACARGLFRGLIGEAFSLAGLAAACLAARFGAVPLGHWLQDVTGGALGIAAPWIAGALLVALSIALVTVAARWLRRGAAAAGLGWADRLGGGALGAAEGALMVVALLLALSWVLGRDHPSLASSRSLAAFEQLEDAVASRDGSLPEVAAPPRR